MAQIVRYSLIVLSLITAASAVANDSSAGFGSGGLEFRQTDAITMEKEDLYISQSSVRVEYLFRNVTASPVDMYIAFPLPRIPMSEIFGMSDTDVPNPNDVNFLGFSTRVNGLSVPMQVQSKAFIGDKDITNDLVQSGVIFNIPGKRLIESFKSLDPGQLAKLKTIGAIADDDVCGEPPCPIWDLETIYFWQQKFEPSSETRIIHTYAPSISSFFFPKARNLIGSKEARFPADQPQFKAWCIEDNFWQTINRSSDMNLPAASLQYILKTANSWKGPIADFTLTIDKGDPTTLISLCANGIRKISPTIFELKMKNFSPIYDLDILFVRRPM